MIIVFRTMLELGGGQTAMCGIALAAVLPQLTTVCVTDGHEDSVMNQVRDVAHHRIHHTIPNIMFIIITIMFIVIFMFIIIIIMIMFIMCIFYVSWSAHHNDHHLCICVLESVSGAQ